jgi:predicted transcriptional regulator
MKDNGTWHNKMREESFKNTNLIEEYNEFKLEFEIAEQLKAMREEKHISLTTVAEKMHSSKSAISRLESTNGGKKHSPSISTLLKYAQAIGCSLKIELIPKI